MPRKLDSTKQLIALTSQKQKRELTADDPLVLQYQEALLRVDFMNGLRTNPRGYYLDVTMTGIPKTSLSARLKSTNDLLRMDLETQHGIVFQSARSFVK